MAKHQSSTAVVPLAVLTRVAGGGRRLAASPLTPLRHNKVGKTRPASNQTHSGRHDINEGHLLACKPRHPEACAWTTRPAATLSRHSRAVPRQSRTGRPRSPCTQTSQPSQQKKSCGRSPQQTDSSTSSTRSRRGRGAERVAHSGRARTSITHSPKPPTDGNTQSNGWSSRSRTFETGPQQAVCEFFFFLLFLQRSICSPVVLNNDILYRPFVRQTQV
jgi:hypothetical protein